MQVLFWQFLFIGRQVLKFILLYFICIYHTEIVFFLYGVNSALCDVLPSAIYAKCFSTNICLLE